MRTDHRTPSHGFALRMIAGGGLLAGLLALTAMSGCAEEEPPPPPPRPVVAAPPPKIDPLAGIELDPRVEWPEETHPSSPELARAIATLANGLARADADEFASVLTPDYAMLTRELVNFGLWKEQLSRVEAVRICVLNELDSTNVELGIGLQTPTGAYLIGFAGQSTSPWRFSGLGITNIEAPRVAMLDGSVLLRPSIPGNVELVSLEEAVAPEEEGASDNSDPGMPIGPRKPRRHFR